MFTLSKDRSKKGKELRMVVVETLQDMMKSDAQVVAMEADLGGASGFTKIQKSNPDRFIQCGISEANRAVCDRLQTVFTYVWTLCFQKNLRSDFPVWCICR